MVTQKKYFVIALQALTVLPILGIAILKEVKVSFSTARINGLHKGYARKINFRIFHIKMTLFKNYII